jgi:hypothetical protein
VQSGQGQDLDALAAQLGGQAQPETTAAGIGGAISRGLAPIAAGAALGAAAGAPLAGVGAIPGAIAGAGAAGLAQLVGDPLVSGINSLLGTRYKAPSDAMADLLTRIGVPEADTEAERIVQSIASGAAGAGGMAAAGQAIKAAAGQAAPTVARIGESLAAGQRAQIAGGAVSGGAAQTAAEMGAGPGGQLAAGLAGGMAGAKAAGPGRVKVPGTSKAEQAVKAAEELNIPVMTSDVVQPQTFIGKSGQQIGERIPIAGTGPLRVQQQAARSEAVRSVLREFGAEEAADLTPNLIKDLGAKRAEELTKYAGLKRDVIGKISGAAGEVPLTKSLKAIDDQIAQLTERRSGPADEAIARLQQIRSELQNRSLSQLESYRADELAAAFKDDPVRPISVAARDIGEKALRAIYGPVREDMGAFIKANGDRRDFEKWMVANKRLSNLSGELQQSTLKSVLKSGNATPEVVNRLLFSAKPSEINTLYSGLSQEGRSMARTAILSKAAEKARVNTPTGEVTYSPDVFLNELRRSKPQTEVFFSGRDAATIDGLERALNLTKRAGQAGVKTATGQETMPFVAGSFLQSVLGSFGATLATAVGLGAAARTYESAPVRNLMVGLSKTKPGSKDEAALFKRISEAVRAQQQTQEPQRIYVGGFADQQEAQQ